MLKHTVEQCKSFSWCKIVPNTIYVSYKMQVIIDFQNYYPKNSKKENKPPLVDETNY